MSFFYADESRWDKVYTALQRSTDRGDIVGADTEFYGADGVVFDIRKESTAGRRVRVHMLSLAVKRAPHVLHPRGYHISDTAVLLVSALEHKGIRSWLESDAPKVFHNLSVDSHAFLGSGVSLGGAFNTLDRARWVWPHRARGAGYSLDSLGSDLLGVGKLASFTEVFGEWVDQYVRTKIIETKVCSCGVEKCRKRKGHEKSIVETAEKVFKKVWTTVPLEDVVPGHRMWSGAVAYAARDAWLALGVQDKIDQAMKQEAPWPWSAT